MLHGVRLSAGRAEWYRNRYVHTPHHAAPDTDYLERFFDPDNSLANTHVVSHAGRVLALEEQHLPYEIDGDLATVGPYDFAGRLAGSMTAHPKICPVTGEMLFFGYALAPPFLTYHRVSADGVLVQTEPITVPAATMMHDFNITQNHVIFMDLPALWGGGAETGLPVNWSDEHGARLGVMPRTGSDADVRWFRDRALLRLPSDERVRAGRPARDRCLPLRPQLQGGRAAGLPLGFIAGRSISGPGTSPKPRSTIEPSSSRGFPTTESACRTGTATPWSSTMRFDSPPSDT